VEALEWLAADDFAVVNMRTARLSGLQADALAASLPHRPVLPAQCARGPSGVMPACPGRVVGGGRGAPGPGSDQKSSQEGAGVASVLGAHRCARGRGGGREAAEDLRAGPCLLVAAEREGAVGRLQVLAERGPGAARARPGRGPGATALEASFGYARAPPWPLHCSDWRSVSLHTPQRSPFGALRAPDGTDAAGVRAGGDGGAGLLVRPGLPRQVRPTARPPARSRSASRATHAGARTPATPRTANARPPADAVARECGAELEGRAWSARGCCGGTV
jgi:hypothetical protein